MYAYRKETLPTTDVRMVIVLAESHKVDNFGREVENNVRVSVHD